MIRPALSRYDSLRDARRSLARAAWWVRFGLFSAGVSMCLDQGRSLLSDAQFTWAERRIMGVVALTWLGGFALAGWVAGKLLSTSAELLDVFADQAEASARTAELLELHAVPALNRIALALEKATPPPAPPAATRPDPKAQAADAARRAIDSGRWGQADRLVGAFVRDHPGPEAAALLAALDGAHRRAADDLRDRLEEARIRGDVEAAVDHRDALTQHLRGDPLRDLDRDLARWLAGEIRRQARDGVARPVVAARAARILDSLGDMPEVAPLRSLL
ncbi:hypothetical protein TA3x_003365 [Tundrisphaera sp. TA3]|uniref:hypothetical protein n=1 Tax=Tundrisphaera sp. TA3 TaxID=3435775 RepID=UPI003EBEF4D9